MQVAVTGGTGFIGRVLIQYLLAHGHSVVAWYRPESKQELAKHEGLKWVPGELGNAAACEALVTKCDALVHAALWRPGSGFRGGEGDLTEFVTKNVTGSIQLLQTAHRLRVSRAVVVSSCAVHEKILPNRPLDETHPLWPGSHYGAYKAALEAFVHSFAEVENWNICAIRPTGVYGINFPVEKSKWYGLVAGVKSGRQVNVRGGGKEVHVADVARAIGILLDAPELAIRGQAFACYDRYVSEHQVATLANEIAESEADIRGSETRPKNEIAVDKIRALGMTFGGLDLLTLTIEDLVAAAP